MPPAPTIWLPRRQLFEIPDARCVRILCTAGCLWLTLDHDSRDVILAPGDGFEAARAGRVLLYAFEPSAFALLPAPERVRGGLAQRHAGCPPAAGVWAAVRAARPG